MLNGSINLSLGDPRRQCSILAPLCLFLFATWFCPVTSSVAMGGDDFCKGGTVWPCLSSRLEGVFVGICFEVEYHPLVLD